VIISPAVPEDLHFLLGVRREAAAWLAELGTDQWQRPYPAERLAATIEAGRVFMLRDGEQAVATITLDPEPEAGLWTKGELRESSYFITKLTVVRSHAGQNLGGQLLDWAGDRAYRAGAKWLRLDAWTTNEGLQRYYLERGFSHVRTVTEGEAVNGGPRVSGWLAQRAAAPAAHGLDDRTPPPSLVEGD
jgi:GNAT superfamily N-acetyltransferase